MLKKIYHQNLLKAVANVSLEDQEYYQVPQVTKGTKFGLQKNLKIKNRKKQKNIISAKFN